MADRKLEGDEKDHPIHYRYQCREHGRVLMECSCKGDKKVIETHCALSCSQTPKAVLANG